MVVHRFEFFGRTQPPPSARIAQSSATPMIFFMTLLFQLRSVDKAHRAARFAFITQALRNLANQKQALVVRVSALRRIDALVSH
jgi:hypothetical protein